MTNPGLAEFLEDTFDVSFSETTQTFALKKPTSRRVVADLIGETETGIGPFWKTRISVDILNNSHSKVKVLFWRDAWLLDPVGLRTEILFDNCR